MRSSPLFALMAASGPVAVLSSPRPPPGWEIEIITVTFDTARKAHHPPHIPGATTTAADTSLGAGEPTGTLTDPSPIITSEPEPGDECENEGISSLSLDTYPTTTGSVSDYGAATDLSTTSSSLSSSATTLSTSLVAKNRRRQVDDSTPTTTTSASNADTSIPAGVTAPDGYAGTGYPASLTSNTEGLPSITPGAPKKVKGSGCSKGPGKSVSKSAELNTSTGQSALMDAYGGATSSSASVSSMATTTSASSSSAVVGM